MPTFFLDPPKEFTHLARFYGVPCYYRADGAGAELCGTNKLFDFLIIWVCPHIHEIVSFLYYVLYGEPLFGFPIKIIAEIPPEIKEG